MCWSAEKEREREREREVSNVKFACRVRVCVGNMPSHKSVVDDDKPVPPLGYFSAIQSVVNQSLL